MTGTTRHGYKWLFSFSRPVAVLIWIGSVLSCRGQYHCDPHPDGPILCQDNQLSTASLHCSGDASICDAVSSWDLTLNCSSCSLAKKVQWNRDTKPLPYNTSVAKIPAKDVEPSDSGCYTCVCDSKSYSFSVTIQVEECPYLLVENDTIDGEVYIHPELVQTELNATSVGVLTVNCTNSGWPPPRVSWYLSSNGNMTSVYNFPNYNVTENGQVLVIMFPSREELSTLVTYYCIVSNAVGGFTAEQQIHLQAYYDYFLTPHESQSHGSVTMSDGKVGAAYCAVNPEDGVEIYYKVCIYHGGQTDLDWVAAPFIANGSSECCQCGMCGERVLGPGVTATPSLSPPNSNNFSVPACQVRSKTASSSFVCLAHRETEVVSSKEQALALFHFQLVLPHQLQPQNPIPLLASIILIVVCPAQFAVIMCLCCVICKWIRRSKSEHPGTTGSFINGSTDHRHGGGEGGQSAVEHNADSNSSNAYSAPFETDVPFEMCNVAHFILEMAPRWSQIGNVLGLHDEVNLWIGRPEPDDVKCGHIFTAAFQQEKLTSWQHLIDVLEGDAVKLHRVARSIRQRYGTSTNDADARGNPNGTADSNQPTSTNDIDHDSNLDSTAGEDDPMLPG